MGGIAVCADALSPGAHLLAAIANAIACPFAAKGGPAFEARAQLPSIGSYLGLIDFLHKRNIGISGLNFDHFAKKNIKN